MDRSAPQDGFPEDPNAVARSSFRMFVTEAVTVARAASDGFDRYQRRIPYYNVQHDEQFTRLESYPGALQHIGLLHEVREQYGPDETKRLLLQLLYAYFDLVREPVFDEGCFDSTWLRFQKELATPEWRHVAFTILQNFASTTGRIEIAEGISICLRTPEHVRGAIGNDHLEWLMDDWMQGAHGSHALLVEYRERKDPSNVIRGDSYHTFLMMRRALLAVRLLKQGNLRTGRFHWIRPALIPSHESGRRSSGSSMWQPGAECRIEPCDIPALQELYAILARFEDSHAKSWKNVETALRWFAAIYENAWNNPQDSVIDAVIAIEALVGTDQEITHRLSSRVAGLLATDDDARVALYRAMKQIYETRSTIVHGGELKKKHRAVLEDLTPLMDILRSLLSGFLRLASGNSQFSSRTRIADEIDSILLHAKHREELRVAMGLASTSRP
jgi:hypothetical protein